MTPLERLKLIQAYHQARQTAQNATGLVKVIALKEARDLLNKLGYEYPKTPKLPELVLPENSTYAQRGEAVNQWLKDNVQGKTITATNGAKIRFNSKQSTKHLTFDGRFSVLAAKAITFVLDVFQTGEYVGRQELYKDRNKDNFVAFHVYRKWIEIDGFKLHVEAKAGERADGALEALSEKIAYSQKIIAKENQPSIPNVENNVLDGFRELSVGLLNNTAICDKLQADTETSSALLTILQIIDPYGNII